MGDVVSTKNRTKKKKRLKIGVVLTSAVLTVLVSAMIFILCYVFVPRNPKIESTGFLDINQETQTATCVVDNETAKFDFDDIIKVPKNNRWTIYSDFEEKNEIENKQVELNPGDNVFYLVVKNTAGESKTYIITIKRKQMFKITFNTNGGSLIEQIAVEEGLGVGLPGSPTRTGYVFAGWFVDEDLTTKFEDGFVVNDNLVLYAKWVTDIFTITYHLNGGTNSELNPQTYTINDEITLADPTRESYVFDGWFYDENFENEVEEIITSTENLTLYAKWIDYIVSISHSNKQAVKSSDVLSAEFLEAVATDNAGNTFEVSVMNETGTQNGGDVIVVKLTATGLYGEIATEYIQGVRVYENIKITYNREALFIHENEQFEDFVVATDEFDEDAEIVVQIVDGEFTAGNVVTINVTATDVAGNTKQKQFTLDVLSASQVYVAMFDEVNDFYVDYEILETNQDFELNEKYAIYDDSNKSYTNTAGESIRQFNEIGYKKVYISNFVLIETAEDLTAIAGTEISDKVVFLNSNINLGGVEWNPITFSGGAFKGNNFVVSNFKITTGRQWNGFFRSVSNSTIENFGLENLIINYEYNGSSFDVGGLVATSTFSNIINCYSTGNISISGKYDSRVGGLIGNDGSSVITGCYSTVDIDVFVIENRVYAAGLIGELRYSSTTEILNCYATGDVSAESEQSYAYVGGLVGITTSSATIKNSYATGEISAVNTDLTGSTYIGRLYASGNPEVVGCYELMGAIKINAKEDLTKYSNYTSVVDSFELVSDIDLEGAEWIPIGLLGGSFNGNGFVISNFKITTGRQGNGFFSSVSNSTIENLGLESFTINYEYSKGNSAGCLVGYLSSSNIKNCYAIGDISVKNTRTDYENYVGGLIGKSNSSNLSNCYTMVGLSDKFTGQILTGCKPYAGGLIGYDTSSTITNCYASGNVYSHGQEGLGGSDIYSGGLIGNASSSIITNCYASGSVTSYVSNANARQDRTYAGGLVGYSTDVIITACYRYESQEIEASSASKTGSSNGIVATINTEGVSASMEEIWAFVKENYDDEIWNLFDDQNPTLKFEESE